ncbi:MAG: hypothetical protein ACE5HD_01415 [Acidobacteriota bacterium]
MVVESLRKALPAAFLVACLSPQFAVPAHALGKPKAMVVRGRVTDSEGRGVSQVPVRVLATRRVFRFLALESTPAEAELASVTTDINGFYELTVPKTRDYDFYFVRFYDAHGFDMVKFSLPADIEITGRINRRRPVIVDEELRFAPGWEAVQRLVKVYGPGSARGRIVRELGVPDRADRTFTAAGIERETWWFDRASVAYVIEDGKVKEKKLFTADQGFSSIVHQ